MLTVAIKKGILISRKDKSGVFAAAGWSEQQREGSYRRTIGPEMASAAASGRASDI